MKNNVKKIVVNNFKDKIKPIANKPKPKINYIERYPDKNGKPVNASVPIIIKV